MSSLYEPIWIKKEKSKMARGSIAKEEVAKKIIECFGQENVIESDKKLYINTKENGERIQICISMTCPKTLVGEFKAVPDSAFGGGSAFDNVGAAMVEPEPFKPAEITPEERETVQDLMKRLGL